MKEATGELNVTVVVVIIVALLSFFFFSIIWPNIKVNFRKNTACDEAICVCLNKDSRGMCIEHECHVKGKPNEKITCAWKG